MTSTEPRERDDGLRAAPGAGRARAAAHGLFAAALLSTVALDQLTKHFVRGWLAPGERWPGAESALTKVFTFTHVHNTGMAFGLGQGRSEVFALIATIVVLGLMVYQSRLPLDAGWLRLALGLQAGGAIGNLTDRLRRGYVTDFFDLQVWPVFNIADSAIFIGVAILAWHLWRTEDDGGRSAVDAERTDVDAGRRDVDAVQPAGARAEVGDG